MYELCMNCVGCLAVRLIIPAYLWRWLLYKSSMVPLALCSGTSKSASFTNATWKGRRSSEAEWTTSASKVTLQLETYVRGTSNNYHQPYSYCSRKPLYKPGLILILWKCKKTPHPEHLARFPADLIYKA